MIELFERRSGPRITSDTKRYARTFIDTPNLAETNAPSIGDLMEGQTGIAGARVTAVAITPDLPNGRMLIRVSYETIIVFSGGDGSGSGPGGGDPDATFVELARSRFKDETFPEDTYVRRWAWDGTAPGPVAIGDNYVGTSGLHPPQCVRFTDQREWSAGRTLVTAFYSEPQIG
jgi:hypothetical protein